MVQGLAPVLIWPNYRHQEQWDIDWESRKKDVVEYAIGIPRIPRRIDARTRKVDCRRQDPPPCLNIGFTQNPTFLPIIQLPGLDFFKAWMDCYRAHYLCWTCGGDLGTARLRDFMWDPATQCGVLRSFDIRFSANSHVDRSQTYVEPGDSMLSDLLDCKEYCKWRSKRVSLDRIEPYVWTLAELCLGGGGLELRPGTGIATN